MSNGVVRLPAIYPGEEEDDLTDPWVDMGDPGPVSPEALARVAGAVAPEVGGGAGRRGSPEEEAARLAELQRVYAMTQARGQEPRVNPMGARSVPGVGLAVDTPPPGPEARAPRETPQAMEQPTAQPAMQGLTEAQRYAQAREAARNQRLGGGMSAAIAQLAAQRPMPQPSGTPPAVTDYLTGLRSRQAQAAQDRQKAQGERQEAAAGRRADLDAQRVAMQERGLGLREDAAARADRGEERQDRLAAARIGGLEANAETQALMRDPESQISQNARQTVQTAAQEMGIDVPESLGQMSAAEIYRDPGLAALLRHGSRGRGRRGTGGGGGGGGGGSGRLEAGRGALISNRAAALVAGGMDEEAAQAQAQAEVGALSSRDVRAAARANVSRDPSSRIATQQHRDRERQEEYFRHLRDNVTPVRERLRSARSMLSNMSDRDVVLAVRAVSSQTISDLATSQQRGLATLLLGIQALELKDRSGAAVSVPEFERIKREIGTGSLNPSSLRAGLNAMWRASQNEMRAHEMAYADVVERLRAQRGGGETQPANTRPRMRRGAPGQQIEGWSEVQPGIYRQDQ